MLFFFLFLFFYACVKRVKACQQSQRSFHHQLSGGSAAAITAPLKPLVKKASGAIFLLLKQTFESRITHLMGNNYYQVRVSGVQVSFKKNLYHILYRKINSSDVAIGRHATRGLALPLAIERCRERGTVMCWMLGGCLTAAIPLPSQTL